MFDAHHGGRWSGLKADDGRINAIAPLEIEKQRMGIFSALTWILEADKEVALTIPVLAFVGTVQQVLDEIIVLGENTKSAVRAVRRDSEL